MEKESRKILISKTQKMHSYVDHKENVISNVLRIITCLNESNPFWNAVYTCRHPTFHIKIKFSLSYSQLGR